ncbi:hypothetical protein BpHYR1_019635 [Brachionus plicatilis]|uniref:Uncharacterized protein n=1 Tax=Brachionus plicatilis TaxID=10195 RepID=A0A3M7P504_BRAPC|nr:hypothetical protein BpHYR1_019635 [Brachionus plicatilis]
MFPKMHVKHISKNTQPKKFKSIFFHGMTMRFKYLKNNYSQNLDPEEGHFWSKRVDQKFVYFLLRKTMRFNLKTNYANVTWCSILNQCWAHDNGGHWTINI